MSGAQVFPFGSDVRLATGDPSFVRAGRLPTGKLYLLGVLNGPGQGEVGLPDGPAALERERFRVADEPQAHHPGRQEQPAKVAQVTVQPGRTERLENVLFTQWGLRAASGC